MLWCILQPCISQEIKNKEKGIQRIKSHYFPLWNSNQYPHAYMKPHKYAVKEMLHSWGHCTPYLGSTLPPASLYLCFRRYNYQISTMQPKINMHSLPILHRMLFLLQTHPFWCYKANLKTHAIVICVFLLPTAVVLVLDYFVSCIGKIAKNR